MKIILLLFFSGMTHLGHSQHILIPYRVGTKFGLCNEKGQIVLKPVYDNLNWVDDQYFETYTEVLLYDTLETALHQFSIRNKKVVSKGLLYRDKVIIKDEPFKSFEIIVNKCIVAKTECRFTDYTKAQFKKYKFREKFICLLNLKGKNVYPENFKRLQKFDTAGVSKLNKRNARYILFGSQNFEDRYSLFVFDIDKQQITDWLLKDIQKIKVTDANYPQYNIRLECTFQDYSVNNMLLDYSTGKFVLINLGAIAKKKNGQGNGSGSVIEERKLGTGEYDNVAVPMMEDIKSGQEVFVEPEFKPYHQFLNDSLFYVSGYKEKKFIRLPEDIQLIFIDGTGRSQYQPVIYKQQKKFGIIRNGLAGDLKYDSVIYLGNDFIVYETINGFSKCGIIHADGTISVPVVYDSIQAGIKIMDVGIHRNATNGENYYELRESDERYVHTPKKRNPYVKQATDKLMVFSQGKAGVISNNNEVIIPVEYDMIAENGLQYSKPMNSKYYILKKDSLYGLTQLVYNKDLKRYEMQHSVKPVFLQVPCYIIKNYFDVKGFQLIGLYDEKFNFKGYASSDGQCYFSEK